MALTDKLTAIGNAIREKTGKSDLLTLDQMPTEIQGITTTPVDYKIFKFKDYKGATIAEYTYEEMLNLQTYPEVPHNIYLMDVDRWRYIEKLPDMLSQEYYKQKGFTFYPYYNAIIRSEGEYYVDYTPSSCEYIFIKINDESECTFNFHMSSYSSSYKTEISTGDGKTYGYSGGDSKRITHTYKPTSFPASYVITFRNYRSSGHYANSYFDTAYNDDKSLKCIYGIIGEDSVLYFNYPYYDNIKFVYGKIPTPFPVNDFTYIKSSSETNNYMRRNKNCYFPGITDLASAYSKNILNPDVTILQQFYCDADDMEIWFPDQITKINYFYNVNAEAVTGRIIHMPKSISYISSLNISQNRSCIFDFRKSTSVPTLSSSISLDDARNYRPTIIVPDSLYSSWKTATNWSTIGSFIKKASEVSL